MNQCHSEDSPLVVRYPFAAAIARTIWALMLLAVQPVWGATAKSDPQSSAAPCQIVQINFDDSTTANASKNYQKTVASVLAQERFDDLDCLANSLRQSKARFASGAWKLRSLYWGISEPQGHATPEDWTEFLDRLNRWVSTKPDSITARVALAKAYAAYGWVARGEDSADSVTANGWKLFAERTIQAKQVLDDASKLPTKCPEWYFAMQQVAMAQGWEKERATALLQQAVAFEPTYEAYYRRHADYLAPMWFGEEGEAAKFAEQSADQIGGEQGDILYFQIASDICHCDHEPLAEKMSWPRVQKGFAALEKKYGPSIGNLNMLAYLAVKAEDPAVAEDAFKRIGDRQDEDVFRRQSFFDECKSWATQTAPDFRWRQQVLELASSVKQTAEGRRYTEAIEQQVLTAVQKCVQAMPAETEKFEILLGVSPEGMVNGVRAPSGVIECLGSFREKFEGLPPAPHVWVKIDIDPVTFTRAATN